MDHGPRTTDHGPAYTPAPALKSAGLDEGPPRLRLRNTLVVAQVTLSLLLVIAAGLLVRSLQRAAEIHPGFDQTNVDVASLDLSLAGYKAPQGRQFVRDLVARVRARPGIESASAAIDLPLDGGRFGMGALRVPGVELPDGADVFPADWNVIEPGYFRTMKLSLLAGRDFVEADTANAAFVAIVNAEMARQLWPGQSPIGKPLEMEGPQGRQALTVVGVAANAQLIALGADPEPYIYVPFAQQYVPRVSVLVRRTAGASAIPQVRAVLREMNPNLPLTEAMPLSEVTAFGLVPQRVAASVAGSLGIVGLLLAAIGIYGVTSYGVNRRLREIGIRIALGADSQHVLRLVLRQGVLLAGIGLLIGVPVAAAGSRLLQSLLFGVDMLDPVTFGGACGLFAVITLIASYLPARRATRVDPMVALRAE